ncbi:hypothetical protein [Erythrobacter mangrovi]|uniref:Uncharacterized protein n=1 Tax=Erythrobacter mangrovi TaxID=2739433 RepID=A0A7D3XZZ1_9SPHN|nr:hypothetical protein [Erythrobacter mangrovi]QKG71372.1 hypothetical protein HQR01_08325 [Erythrobacter mangrovi]
MKRSSTAWAIVFSAGSGIYWFIVATILDVVAPMMLDDGPWLSRVAFEFAAALILYVAVCVFFLRWLTGNERS